MRRRLPGVAFLLAVLCAAGAAGASRSAATPASSARAVAVQVVSPSGGATGGVASSPPNGAASGSFAYPGDGSIASVASLTATTTAAGTSGGSSASATAAASSISLFGGEITADAAAGAANVSANPAGGSGDFSGAGVSNLVALGQGVSSAPGTHVSLADWGYADVLSEAVTPGSVQGAPSYAESMTALAVHLIADHGGLPAGSSILIGYAQASAEGTHPVPPAPPATTTTTTPAPPPPPPPPTTTAISPPPPPPPPVPTTTPAQKPTSPSPAKPAARAKPVKTPKAPEPPEAAPGASLRTVHTAPLTVTPKLTANRYVFPVYGPSSYTDTFGAPRADVVWHHGDDIFAPLGAPVLAVADGVVFSVGWNHIGGYRLWVRDDSGNEFYYAHLSAYSPLATNGRRVQAGAVLAFVGNTGDAAGTPYHLHFEVHPKALLKLGYDGAVDPTQYLDAWRHLQDVRLTEASASGYVPRKSPRPKRPVKAAPSPGAILLQATDISTGNGLDPSSLRRALAVLSHEGEASIVGAYPSPPSGAHPLRAG